MDLTNYIEDHFTTKKIQVVKEEIGNKVVPPNLIPRKEEGTRFFMFYYDGKHITAGLHITVNGLELTYDSFSIKEGKGYNTLLRKYLMCTITGYIPEGEELEVWTYSVNPISDHILRKLGVKRTEEFEMNVKLVGEEKYIEAVEKVKKTHSIKLKYCDDRFDDVMYQI
jgi:hypothetical protein